MRTDVQRAVHAEDDGSGEDELFAPRISCPL